MNILIIIDTDSELIAYEAMALAMLLASFDHAVQLQLGAITRTLLTDTRTRLYGMIQSLPLYDLPPAWVCFSTDGLDTPVAQVLHTVDTAYTDDFDSTLTFR